MLNLSRQIYYSQPVNRRHPLNQGLTGYWRVLPKNSWPILLDYGGGTEGGRNDLTSPAAGPIWSNVIGRSSLKVETVSQRFEKFNVSYGTSIDTFVVTFVNTLLYDASASGDALIQFRYGAGASTAWYMALGAATGLLTNEYITLVDSAGGNLRTGVTDGGSISANELHQLVFSWDGNKYRIFLDGIEKTVVSTPSGHARRLTTSIINHLLIGCLDGEGGGPRIPFQGHFMDLRTYSWSFEAPDVRYLWEETQHDYDSMLNHLPSIGLSLFSSSIISVIASNIYINLFRRRRRRRK